MAKLMTLEEAREALLLQASRERLTTSERVALGEADGRVLAEPLHAALDLPPWPNSAMDGYALRFEDWVGVPLPVSQKIFAGSAPAPLQSGTCARIFTGAPLPEGADTVEMQENTRLAADGSVEFTEALQRGRHVRPRGGEAQTGELVLERGTRLGPVELALAASLGAVELAVVRRPRVALLSTGDELREPGSPLGPGQIYNSNRYLLASWLRRLGCAVQDEGVLADDPQQIREVLDSLKDVDLILATGGVSVGEADYLGQILQSSGELTLWKLAIKPGKPLTCARYQDTPVIGLPGNPASALVTFGLLARPYLLRRLGIERVIPLALEVPAKFERSRPGNRREFMQARVVEGRVVLHENQSSAVLRSAAWADGLVELPEGQVILPGQPVRFIPYSELID